jgi:hypothetical protein
LAADDIIFSYPMRLWAMSGKDPILADLSRRYLERDLFKARNITQLSEEQRQTLVAAVQAKMLQDGLDPESYLGIRSAHVQGYSFYDQGIQLKTERGYEEIAHLSPLVRALVETQRQVWLIFPRPYGDIVEGVLSA